MLQLFFRGVLIVLAWWFLFHPVVGQMHWAVLVWGL